MNIQVTKRDGSKEDFNIEKIHRVITWATNGLSDVSISDIEMNAELNLFDGISTSLIHEVLIRSANDLISKSNPNYQYVAARLLNYSLRKQVWGESEPPRLYDHLVKMTNAGVYDKDILSKYNKSEILKLGKYLKHERDETFTYSGLQQLVDKYLIKNRMTGEIYETPQFAYMLIAMTGFIDETKDRIKKVKNFYDYISKFKISLPTPIIAGVRSPLRQYASCALFDCGDSLDSIFSTVTAIGHYSAKRAGIGLNVGRIRPINSFIRGGEVVHTGLIPYLKVFESVVKSTQQNGLRGASLSSYLPFWHYEIEDVIVLKNNAGTDDNRVRKIDYCIQFSELFYKRFLNDEMITLFSPHECEDLYLAFGQPEFDELYLAKEKDSNVKIKKQIRARELAELFVKERLETGRIYVMNIDHVNSNSPFADNIYMSNLCIAGEMKVHTIIDGQLKLISMRELHDLMSEGVEVKVLSRNTETSEDSYENILASARTSESAEVIKISVEDTNTFLFCTEDHMIYTKNRGYVKAKNILKEDVIETYSGLRGRNFIERTGEKRDVYDITVENNANFYVNDILVHNCVEITQPTNPLTHIDDEDGEIGTCILGAINMDKVSDDMEDVCKSLVRFLDNLIDYQEYPIKAAENFTLKRRSLGIGLTNYAGFLAKKKIIYGSKEAVKLLHDYSERLQYHLLGASCDLAEERGPCEKYGLTTYAAGTLPIDRYNKNVDAIAEKTSLGEDKWEALRGRINSHGLRHSTLTAQMPVESSSVVQNATNGLEPIRDVVAYKKSKQGVLKQLCPYIENAEYYVKAWDLKGNQEVNNSMAVVQKWFDMSISTNHYYNYSQYPGSNIPLSVIMKDVIHAYKMGLKTLYYCNTPDGSAEKEETSISCESGACTL